MIANQFGKLYLVPIANTEGETTTYTSGRIHTQGNKDFKYGLFEARIKTPKGKGYLPACLSGKPGKCSG